MSNTSIRVASTNGYVFTNTSQYDVCYYTQSNTQKMLFGVNSNQTAALTISSNLLSINGNIVTYGTTTLSNAASAIALQPVSGNSLQIGAKITMGSDGSFQGSNVYLGPYDSNLNLKHTSVTLTSAALTQDAAGKTTIGAGTVTVTDSKMGINVSAPSTTLHVGGNATVNGTLVAGSNITAGGSIVLTNGTGLSALNIQPDATCYLSAVAPYILITGDNTALPGTGSNARTLYLYGSNITYDSRFGHHAFLTGNVGVGTSEPTSKLHVVGTTFLHGNMVSHGTTTLSNGTSAVVLQSVTGNNLRIGTNITLYGDGSLEGQNVYLGTQGSNLNLKHTTVALASAALTQDSAGKTTVGAGTVTVTDGKMGINVSAPSTTLHVGGTATINGTLVATSNIRTDRASMVITSATGISALGIRGDDTCYLSAVAPYILTSGDNTALPGTSSNTRPLYLYGSNITYNSRFGHHAFLTGNVGVGTSEPTSKLHVVGTTFLHGNMVSHGTTTLSNGTSAVVLQPLTGNNLRIGTNITLHGDGSLEGQNVYLGTQGSNLNLKHTTVALASAALTQDAAGKTTIGAGTVTVTDGYVGVGTTNPSAPLHVTSYKTATFTAGYYFSQGTSALTAYPNATSVTHGILCDNSIAAASYYAFSDARIKKSFLQTDTIDTAKLWNLPVIKFSYVDSLEHGGGVKYGFKAQDVETSIPEAVSQVKGYIPDVFKVADGIVGSNAIRLSGHSLKEGDSLRLVTAPNGTVIAAAKVIAVTDDTFAVDTSLGEETTSVFVYGRNVEDKRIIDHDQLVALSIRGMQEMKQSLDSMRAEIENIKSRLDNTYKA